MSRNLERKLLALLLVWSALVHGAFALLSGPPNFWDHYEGVNYLNAAHALVEGRGYPEPLITMPLYNLMLAGTLWLFGKASVPLLFLHIGFGMIITLFTYKSARLLFPPSVALLAGGFVSVHPYLVKLTMQIIDTGPSVALTTFAMWLLMKAWSAPEVSSRRYAAAGAVMALATLVRPVGGITTLVLSGGVFVGLLLKHNFRQALSATTLVVLVWAVVMSPWWVYNYQRYGYFIPLTTHGGPNLLKGHTAYYTAVHPTYDTDHYPYFQRLRVEDDPSGYLTNKRYTQAALSYVRAHPGAALLTDLKKIVWLYGWHKVPRSLAHSDAEWDATNHLVVEHGTLEPAPQDIIYSLYWIPVSALSLVGLIGSRQRWREFVPVYLLLAANALTVVLTFADTRYRLEADPYIVMWSAYGFIFLVTRVRNRIHNDRPKRRAVIEAAPTSLCQPKTPVNVLYLITELSVVGGAEKVLLSVLARLDRSRFIPTVACLYGGESVIARDIRTLGIPVIDLKMTKKWRLDALWRLYRLLRSTRPAILHNSMFHANLIGRLIGRLSGVPIVVSWRHNVDIGGKAREWINRWTVALDDCVIAVSDLVGQAEIDRAKVPPQQVVTIYNGISLEEYAPDTERGVQVRRALNVGQDTLLLGTVGRMHRQKDFANLIQATAEVHAKLPNIHLLLVGDGELRTELVALADQLGVSQYATFAGIRQDVPEILTGLDIFVLSSRWEGHPLVVLEAMAAGLPVVATTVGGVPEIVSDGKTGLLVPPENPTALANAILQLQEPKSRQRLGSAARENVIERFSIAETSSRIEQLYCNLLDKKGLL